ncbi:MAG: hypothetical protein HYY16_16985 [Planctomycetes bacterium]|nr:hypothetical protein [Planctomycetota bacterium]
MRSAAVGLALCMGACWGCGSDDSSPDTSPPDPATSVDLDVDTDRNGVVDAATDEDGEDAWTASRGAVFYANIDDEDGDELEDAKDSVVNGTADGADLARVVVRGTQAAPDGAAVSMSVSSPAQGRVRIFRRAGGNWTQAYETGASFSLPQADVAAGDVELGVEATQRLQPAWDGRVTLTLEIRDASGGLIGSDVVLLRCAPWLMSCNLWPMEELHVVNLDSDNALFRSTFADVCAQSGVTYREVPGAAYSYDQWLQDSSEDGGVLLPAAGGRRRIRSVLQCARWRPVDRWCRDTLWGPDFDFIARFSTNNASENYGGNLEISGPLPGKPWGRIIVGGGTSAPIGGGPPVTRRMVSTYRTFFDALAIQGPHLEVSTEWLAVGHVDEHTQIVPAAMSPRGWAIAFASPALARTLLLNVQASGGGNLPVFEGRGGYETTVNAILSNTALMTFNQEAQLRLNAIRSVYVSELGLADSEIVDLPVLYEDAGDGYAVAYNPAVVNLAVIPSSSGMATLVVPDPEGPDQPVDVWKAETTARLEALGVAVRYVDVFFSYHVLMGQAHCGVNWVRTPPAREWWGDMP